MRRRSFLLGLCASISVSGCLSSSLSDAEGNAADTASYPMQLETDNAQTDWPIRYDVELLHDRLRSPDTPLTLDVSLTNVSDEELSYQDRYWALGERAMDGPWMFVGTDIEPIPYAFDEAHEMWVINAHRHRQGLPITDSLDPGNSVSQRLALGIVDNESTSIPELLEFEVNATVEPSSENKEYKYEFSLIG